jgi:ribosomal protein S18 acetylase RimI-like enzyme
MQILHETHALQYELFYQKSLLEMALLVAEAFIHSEPMTINQGFSVDEFANYIKFLGAWTEQEKLTVIARDKQTNELVGALIAGDFASASPLEIDNISDKFKPIMELLEKLEVQYKQDKNIRTGEYLHLYMLAVAPPRRGQKIAQNLIQTCLGYGMKKGYRTALTEATHSISQHIFGKLGFVGRHEMLYKQFTYQGQQVLKSIEGHTGTIFMDKALV